MGSQEVPERLPTYRHQLRFHSRNVCQRPLQDHAGAAVWSPLHCIHRESEMGDKTSIAHLVSAAFAHLLLLRALRAFLELSVDRAAKNSPRQALPSALPCPNTEVARPDIDSTVCYLWPSALYTINKSMTHR